ncbi:MAG: hypothetical protein GY720_10660 [bacterium]|nr:hypothetical protein [bacterium]
MRRVRFAAALSAVLVVASVAPALADEFGELVESASEADFAGRQIVATFLDGETAFEIIDVEHAGSMMMTGSQGHESMIGSGKLSGGDGGAIAVSSWNSSQMSDRYEVGSSSPVKRLDREATAIEIHEDGMVRMRLVFDEVTGAPLVTEVFDGGGNLFRLSSMLEIDKIPGRLYSARGHYADEFEVLVPTSRHSLPAEAAGYNLADAYTGPTDSVQGFYSDGLFSFSLFLVEGSADSQRFSDADTVEVDGLKYRRLVNPGEIWVTWRANGDTYVLVGDLPPDHLEEVLDQLPKPGRRNLLGRLWSGLFG